MIFDASKTGWNIMIDSWDYLMIGRPRLHYHGSSSNGYGADSGSKRWQRSYPSNFKLISRQ